MMIHRSKLSVISQGDRAFRYCRTLHRISHPHDDVMMMHVHGAESSGMIHALSAARSKHLVSLGKALYGFASGKVVRGASHHFLP